MVDTMVDNVIDTIVVEQDLYNAPNESDGHSKHELTVPAFGVCLLVFDNCRGIVETCFKQVNCQWFQLPSPKVIFPS